MQESEETEKDRAGSTPRWGRRRVGRAIATAAFWSALVVGAVFAGVSVWVRRTFGPISVDQLLSNLKGGAEVGGSGLIVNAVLMGLVIPLASVAVLFVAMRLVRRLMAARGIPRLHAPRLLRGVAAVAAVAVAVTGAALLSATIGLKEYGMSVVREAQGGTDLGDFYVAPSVHQEAGRIGMSVRGQAADAVADLAAEPRNLVLIYLESVEEALSDDELFEKNMLEPVEEATRGWSEIDGFEQYAGGGWTMSGIVSTQCGIPLRSADSIVDIGELNAVEGSGEAYLPGAVCLGDALSDQGYRNVFMGGADARFAGKSDFLATHGYDEVFDLGVWRDEGETEIRDDWGLSDRRLFEHARDEIVRLHESGDPFNLTLLTLDTHEGPRVYDYCDWSTESAMTSITFCSMEQVAAFVEFMGEEGILEDTAVVVMGDHLKMVAEGGSFWDELNALEGRTIFNRVWSPDGLVPARNGVDQLSMFPTILELVGVELDDHRAGVGVSALAAVDEVSEGSILDLDSGEYASVVGSRSTDFYRELWGALG